MSLETILNSLTTNEKIDAMNILWRDLSKTPSNFESPEWHREVLSSRLNSPAAGPSLGIDESISDAKERLNARRTQG